MPRKILELIADLERAGFINRGGKGSHRNFIHPMAKVSVALSGNKGDDAKKYQEKKIKEAIEEASK
ncbi:MAG: hypothetical protein A2008_13940 [Candidatus Wallbacteria bacterium GWC2_49_35]|uniref:Addiction module toxin, HicA family n=1 Tax=Candidatus Wallbacteria bacterium GWC2_49_35 TaxID=1817813 RepID=A0A1F7WSJ4_9BACT|nr:MAG: hypothetical protein A2008_13940 [Candidatus Wallbacteria bacterium GWC2_49_35]HBC76828.1 hypothetical protein [Candidatus Wallbacteria bacterium]